MTLVSDAAQNASLAMSYGPDRHPSLSLPTFEVALFVGDPSDPDAGAVELDPSGGYAAPMVDNDGTTWPDPPDAGQIVSAPITLPTSTGPWMFLEDGDLVPAIATHWAIRDPDTSDLWDSMPLPGDGISVEVAGTENSIRLIVNYNDLED